MNKQEIFKEIADGFGYNIEFDAYGMLEVFDEDIRVCRIPLYKELTVLDFVKRLSARTKSDAFSLGKSKARQEIREALGIVQYLTEKP